jgi:hypothetical protein
MRHAVVFAFAVAVLVHSERAATDQPVSAWYPVLGVGNTWIYAEEARDADGRHGIDNPTVGRWTTTEAITAVDVVPEGTRVTIQSTVSDVTRINGWTDSPSRLTPRRTELLVRANCVYQLTTAAVSYPDDIWSAYDASHRIRPEFRNALRRGEEPAAFCFPMAAGGEWGRVPTTAPDEGGVWKIRSLNGDPFGAPGVRTFHVYGHQGSGDTTDYWFQEGVGVVQFVEEHHGTYDEYRRRLTSSTLAGITHTYALQPARTVALDPGECRAGWRHWIRANGTLLPNYAACVAYARTHP